ncbi:hypothetical protein [uncultured Roseivirga sp.]|uniref:hypothetical protein n=1 Tax=uncultured Roseivirga sp. TaxID=543088 RepID=UPI000D7AA105|nr:hypothetical protein [uncultured Roseivirga sp.]PWL30842.1 MAG: hypothetical protein DCO95_05015 [Roseivirga sp. XM-24bin3]
MQRIIHFIQNLSLDITIGAVISSLFLARVINVEVSASMMIGLAIAIWLIYTFDHLRDAYKTKGRANNPRHAFHQKYFNELAGIAAAIFCLGAYNLESLPWPTIRLGFVLIIFSSLYFVYLMLAKKAISKELFAATVYVAGIATAPLSLAETVEAEWVILLLIFWILAYANLLIIPSYEVELDKSDDESSVVTRLGELRVKRLLLFLLVLCTLLIQYFGYLTNLSAAYPILILMVSTLLILVLRPQYFRKYQLYRILSDGIFFLPGIALLV